jgi:phytoene synthase
MASQVPHQFDVEANTTGSDPFSACERLVRVHDEDRWLAAQYAPKTVRKELFAFYALHAEIERVPMRVSEPPLGEIRLQWWREAVAEAESNKPRAHPVVQALAQTALSGNERQAIDRSIDARARILYADRFSEIADFETWTRAAEAWVDVIAARRLAEINPVEESVIADAASALALAKFGNMAKPLEVAARVAELRHRTRSSLSMLPAQTAPALAPFSLTSAYLRSRSPSGITRRIAIFTAVLTGRF